MNVRRLTKEIAILRSSKVAMIRDFNNDDDVETTPQCAGGTARHCRIYLDESNLFKWEVLMIGPRRTIYSRALFRFTIVFPPEYPIKPPVVTIASYDRKPHPNFFPGGHVCLSTINTEKEQGWTPALTVESLLASLYSMLSAESIQGVDNTHGHEKSDTFFPSVMHDSYHISLKLLTDEPREDIRQDMYDYVSQHRDWYLRKLELLSLRYDTLITGQTYPNYYLERDIDFAKLMRQLENIVAE